MAALTIINHAPSNSLKFGFCDRPPLSSSHLFFNQKVQSKSVSLQKQKPRKSFSLRIMAETIAVEEKMGIKIQRNTPESKLTELGVRKWPKWGCPPSKFPWTYSAKETCYLLEGKVKVYPDGQNDYVEFGVGDLVEFPKGMKCTWDVAVAVDKHYNFE